MRQQKTLQQTTLKSEEAKFQCRNKSKSVPVSPSYKQRDVEAPDSPLIKTKSTTSRDEGDGLKKGLLGNTINSSSKSLIGSNSNSNSSEGKSRISREEMDLDLSPDAPMLEVVRAIITLARVENAVWTEGNSHKKWQVGGFSSFSSDHRRQNPVIIIFIVFFFYFSSRQFNRGH